MRAHDEAARFLARGARRFFERVLCPACAAAHWSAVLSELRNRFGAAAAGPLPAALEAIGCEMVLFKPSRAWTAFDAATAAEFERVTSGRGV